MYNHNKAQQSKNRVHISWDILYNCSIWLSFLWKRYLIILIIKTSSNSQNLSRLSLLFICYSSCLIDVHVFTRPRWMYQVIIRHLFLFFRKNVDAKLHFGMHLCVIDPYAHYYRYVIPFKFFQTIFRQCAIVLKCVLSTCHSAIAVWGCLGSPVGTAWGSFFLGLID